MNLSALFGLTLLACLMLVAVFVVIAWGQYLGRSYLRRSTELMRMKKFEQARQSVLAAVRMKSELKQNEEVKEFYNRIVADPGTIPPSVLDRITTLASEYPASRSERIMANPWAQAGVTIYFIVLIIARYLSIGG